MAVHTNGNYITRASGVDLSTSLYKIVKLNANRQLVLSSAASDLHFGVLQDVTAPGVGVNCTSFVRNGAGSFKVILGGNVTIGDALSSNALGLAVTVLPVAAGLAPATEVIGFAQETGVTGQTIEFLASERRI